jgi:hypothetical protein
MTEKQGKNMSDAFVQGKNDFGPTGKRQAGPTKVGRRCERSHHIADTLRCEHQQPQPEQTGFKFVIKGPQERMPRVFDNELETSQRCFRARKLGRTQIKKCKLCYETVPCRTAFVGLAGCDAP